MCNCGKKRSSLNVSARSVTAAPPVQVKIQKGVVARPEASLTAANQTILFQYIGNTALSIIGRITRKSYRFSFPGDVRPVAVVDAPDMKAVPVLKMVES